LNPEDATSLAWVSRGGREEVVKNVPPGDYNGVEISPDGQWAAVVLDNTTSSDIWKLDIDRGTFGPLTFDPSGDTRPVINADSDRIYFSSNRSGSGWKLYAKGIDETGEPELLDEHMTDWIRPVSISPDGSALIYMALHENNYDMMLFPLDGSSPPRALLDTRHNERGGRISPDGRWLAYDSDESGRREVYVRSYPDLKSKTQISINGGWYPRWSADGRELFFRQESTQFMIVTLEPGPELNPSIPELLFEGNYFDYDVHPDGDRFLVVKGLGGGTYRAGGTELIVVENWFEEIRRRQPREAN